MRLLTHGDSGELRVTANLADDDVPPYAILSHTWGKDEEEVVLHEVGTVASKRKAGYQKIEFCEQQAQRDKWRHFWVDTCCIDKANHVELSRAITSMYQWYQRAQVCYVYLADVSYTWDNLAAVQTRPWEASFRKSRWFSRGWTLQELLAPREVVFYSREGHRLGTKSELRDLLHLITSIPTAALDGQNLSEFPVIERMRWTRGRETKEKEDQAYCLLGIFGVYTYLNYGEGDNAFRRLQNEIDAQSHEILATQRHHDFSSQRDEVRPLGLCLASAPLIQPHEFIGRVIELSAMYDILQPDTTTPHQRRVVLGGIGGVGKTQLAIAFAREHQRRYTSVLWFNATSELTLYTSLRSNAGSLVAADVLEKLGNEQALTRFLDWLSRSHNARWLLVFDNYDDPDSFDVDRFCPNVGHGSIIITTRLPDKVCGPQVRVRPLTAINDSLEILQVRSGRQAVHTDVGAHRLAERMAGLPLALVTAGAYLRKTTLSFQQYLDAYERRWHVDRRRLTRIPEYADRTLYTTWNLSFSQLDAEDVEAAQMLRLLAYFDHQDIWYGLLHAGLSQHSPEWLRTCSAEQVDFESVMGKLVEYCFVEVQVTIGSYSMHGCVHDWTLGELNHDVDPMLYWYAFDCVAASINKSNFTTLGRVEFTRVSRHGVRLTHGQFEPCDKVGLSTRLDDSVWIAEMLLQHIQLFAAERMYLRALAGREKALGPDHTSTLDTVNNIGSVYRAQGKLDIAEQVHQRALAGREKALGPNHTSTLDTVNNLGNIYADQGRLDVAEQAYQRALIGYEKALGPNHTSTLDTIGNLGLLYRDQGKFDAAEQMLQQALAGYNQASPVSTIRTINTIYNLGLLYQDQGRFFEAEQSLQRVILGREQTLGTSHALTVVAANTLSELRVRIAQGRQQPGEDVERG